MDKSIEIEKLREEAKNKSRFSKEVKELKSKEKEFEKVIENNTYKKLKLYIKFI